MKSVQTAAPGAIRVVDIDHPVPGPDDVLVRIRACGIRGTDAGHIARGGVPFGPGGALVPAYLGHEPAGENAVVGRSLVVFPDSDVQCDRGGGPGKPDPAERGIFPSAGSDRTLSV